MITIRLYWVGYNRRVKVWLILYIWGCVLFYGYSLVVFRICGLESKVSECEWSSKIEFFFMEIFVIY